MPDDLFWGLVLLGALFIAWGIGPAAVCFLAWLDRRAQRGTDTAEDALREWTR